MLMNSNSLSALSPIDGRYFKQCEELAPFFSESASDTCKKILNWKNNLSFPDKTKISDEAYDLIKKLIIDVDKRLGYNGSEEIKRHPFFKKINWETLLNSIPPFIPEVK